MARETESFSLVGGVGRPFSRVLNIFMMAAGALAEPVEGGRGEEAAIRAVARR